MINPRNRAAGALLLALSAVAFGVSSIALFATWFDGFPTWVLGPAVFGTIAGIAGIFLVTRSRTARAGLSIPITCVGALLVVAFIALKTNLLGDPNIGASFIAMIGVVMQPVGASISLAALITLWVKSRSTFEKEA